jgi:hypothetical protein
MLWQIEQSENRRCEIELGPSIDDLHSSGGRA